MLMNRSCQAILGVIAVLTAAVPAYAQKHILTFVLEENPPQKQEAARATMPSRSNPGRVLYQPTVTYLGLVIRDRARILSSPSRGSLYYICRQGAYIALVGQAGNWYGVLMIDGRIGYVRKTYVRVVGYYGSYSGSQTANYQVTMSDLGQRIVQSAMRYLGIPYRWGGYSLGGLDCSGFVKAVFASNGVPLPRNSRQQAEIGWAVGWSQLQPGDRLYFATKGRQIDHTGIYIGNALFIHSSSSRRGVGIDSLYSPKYYRSLVAARRS